MKNPLKILHVVLYPKLYPAINGGMQRCWNITKQLSAYFETDLLCLQPGIKKLIDSSGEKINKLHFIFPNSNDDTLNRFSKIKRALKYRWRFKTMSVTNSSLALAAGLVSDTNKNNYDFIIMEHLESVPLQRILKKKNPKATFIFDAHNIDHILLQNQKGSEELHEIKNMESLLYKSFQLAFACSSDDAATLRSLNNNCLNVSVIPNGTDIHFNQFYFSERKTDELNIIFCGSLDYEPNIQGLAWFLELVWPALTTQNNNITFTIIGRGHPTQISQLTKKSKQVHLIGEVDDVRPYYHKAHLAIVPLFGGSGTRLKIPEAMALGVPVLSTSAGAEGIAYEHGKNILIANSDIEFIKIIEQILQNKLPLHEISRAARRLVEEKYSWDEIGKKIKDQLETGDL